MDSISVRSSVREEMVDITSKVAATLPSGDGICVLFVQHTTCGLTVNENADPDVQSDMLGFLRRLIPQYEPNFKHFEHNSDAHIKASLMGSSVTVPFENGEALFRAMARHLSLRIRRATGTEGFGEDFMTIHLKWTSVVLLFLISALTITAQTEKQIIESIGVSHIEANVPDRQHFDEYLKRDLAAFFKRTTGKDVSVEYELLRDGPTQTGIAFPKFYAWVFVRENDTLIDQGAVRLAAIKKERFDVTHFLSRAEALKTPDVAGKIFPADVVKKINVKTGRLIKSEA